MRFGLRTLFIVLTAACVYLAYVAYRLDSQGHFMAGGVGHFRGADVAEIAAKVRQETMGHQPGKAFAIPLQRYVPGRRIPADANRYFYDVRLSDGSKTQVGFWVYADRTGVEVQFLIIAKDTYPAVVSGAAAKRGQERVKLMEVYEVILAKMQTEHLSKHEKRPRG